MIPPLLVDQSYYAAVLNLRGLVSYWRLGERTGTVAKDVAGYGNGTYTGSPTMGVHSGYNDLDPCFTSASGKYVTIANATNYHYGTTSAMTWSAWIYPTSSAALTWWFAKGTGATAYEWGMGRGVLPFNAGTGVLCTVWQAGGTSVVISGTASGTVPDNAWTHVVVTCKGTTALRIYLNGKFNAQSTSFSGTPGSSTSAVDIGRRPDASGPFVGNIDEVALWNRALSDHEISELYYAGRK